MKKAILCCVFAALLACSVASCNHGVINTDNQIENVDSDSAAVDTIYIDTLSIDTVI